MFADSSQESGAHAPRRSRVEGMYSFLYESILQATAVSLVNLVGTGEFRLQIFNAFSPILRLRHVGHWGIQEKPPHDSE